MENQQAFENNSEIVRGVLERHIGQSAPFAGVSPASLETFEDPAQFGFYLVDHRPHLGILHDAKHGPWIDNRDRCALVLFGNHHVARQQEPHERLPLQRLQSELGIAGSENYIATKVDIEFGLKGLLDIDLGENAKALTLETARYYLDGIVKGSRRKMLGECVAWIAHKFPQFFRLRLQT